MNRAATSLGNKNTVAVKQVLTRGRKSAIDFVMNLRESSE